MRADVYGEAFSRDIEPTVTGGTVLYDIMASCIKVYRAGASACSAALASEPCCAGEHHLHMLFGTAMFWASNLTEVATRMALCQCAAALLR